MQTAWNTTYNTNTSAVLKTNTEKANMVKEEDKLFSTYVIKSADGKTGDVLYAVKDGDTSIYVVADGTKGEDIAENKEQYQDEKYGETLYDNDYVEREGDSINFDTNIGKILKEKGLYGDNAEEMIGALLVFEGNKDKPYLDSERYLSIGIGLNINSLARFSDIELSGTNDKSNTDIFNELIDYKINKSNILNNYKYKNVAQ